MAIGFKSSQLELVNAEENKKLFQTLNHMSMGQAIDYLDQKNIVNDSFLPFTIYNVYRRVSDQLERIEGYEEYLNKIDSNTKQLTMTSLFMKQNSFTYRSLVKMPSYYMHLKGIEPTLVNSQPILYATNRSYSDLFAVLLIFTLWLILLLEEKENGMLNFLKSTKSGRTKMILGKIGAVSIWCTLIYISLYAVNYFVASYLYGFTDLRHPVQSLENFTGCTLKISIGGYLLLYSVLKIAAYVLIASFILLLCIVAKNIVLVYSGLIVTGGLFILFHLKIAGDSYLAPLKYINPVCYLNTNILFKDYIDINFLGFPINIISCTIVVLVLCISSMIVASLIIFNKQGITEFKSRVYQVLPERIYQRFRKPRKLFYYEVKKSFFVNRIIWVLLFMLLIGFYNYNAYRKPAIMHDSLYKQYLYALEGEVDADTYEYLDQKREYFEDLRYQLDMYGALFAKGEVSLETYHMISNHLRKELEYEVVLQRVRDKVKQFEELGEIPGGKPWLVYDTGYEQLIGSMDNLDMQITQLLFLLGIAVCFAPVYAMDNQIGIGRLLQTTKYGRARSYRIRMILNSVVTMILFISTYLPYVVRLLSSYGTRGMKAPIQSLMDFENFLLKLV